jgi:hypothetical protein
LTGREGEKRTKEEGEEENLIEATLEKKEEEKEDV